MDRLSAIRDCAVANPKVSDYTAEASSQHARPHDLIWFAAESLAADVPAWAQEVISAGEPAVVRRAPRDGHSLPVGIRGPNRSDRYATRIPLAAVTERLSPEGVMRRPLPEAARRYEVPVISAFAVLRRAAIFEGLAWGVTGALGYELATGVKAARSTSDLDLLVRLAQRDDARLASLSAALEAFAAAHDVRIDCQLETPAGGIALADWIGPAAKVLVKADDGPRLVEDPWASLADQPLDGRSADAGPASAAAVPPDSPSQS